MTRNNVIFFSPHSTKLHDDCFQELRFTEGRCRGFGTFVVVLTTRKDSMQFVPKGGKVVSSVDSRITISNKPGTFQHVVSATVEVRVLFNPLPNVKFLALTKLKAFADDKFNVAK